MADFDGDGRPDLLSGSTCCQEPFCFYLFRGRPGGEFGPREQVDLDYPPGEFNRWVEFSLNGLKSRIAVADWNGDGQPDVLIGGGTGAFAVAYGPLVTGESPPGKLILTVKRLWPKGREPIRGAATNLCLADWDGDGLLDLVCGATVRGVRGIYWLRNSGSKRQPELEPPRLLVPFGSTGYAAGLAVADWNEDGWLDLLVSRDDYRERSGQWLLEHRRIWVYLRHDLLDEARVRAGGMELLHTSPGRRPGAKR